MTQELQPSQDADCFQVAKYKDPRGTDWIAPRQSPSLYWLLFPTACLWNSRQEWAHVIDSIGFENIKQNLYIYEALGHACLMYACKQCVVFQLDSVRNY